MINIRSTEYHANYIIQMQVYDDEEMNDDMSNDFPELFKQQQKKIKKYVIKKLNKPAADLNYKRRFLYSVG